MKASKLPLALLLAGLCAPPLHAETTTSNSTTRVIHRDVDDDSADSGTEIQRTQISSDEPRPPEPRQPQQAGELAPPPADRDHFEQTVITEKHPNTSGLRNEAVGINPQFGVIALSDSNGNTTSRGVAGFTFDINGLKRLQAMDGRPFLGPSLGVLYSHLGTSSSDFLGLSNPNGINDGTHLLLFPFDVKMGYTFGDIFRPSIHAGATLIYNNTSTAPTGIEVTNSTTS